MPNYASWGSWDGHAATVWGDAGHFDNNYYWNKFFFTSSYAGAVFNLGRCMNLVIAKCDLMQSQIDAIGTPTEYELTPEKIVEAWAKDDFAGRVITIGFIDRMRQILWDEPFYVAWAARPEQSSE